MATEDPNRRPAGRLLFEAMMWGMGFAIGAGAMHLVWKGITSSTKDDDDDDDKIAGIGGDDNDD